MCQLHNDREAGPHDALQTDMTRIVIADDHAILRDGLKALLATAADMQVVGEAGGGQEAVKRTLELDPDVLLLDISMPDVSGIEVLRVLRNLRARVSVVMLSMHAAPAFVQAALSAGADGYVDKGSAYADLLHAVRTVRSGGRFLSPGVDEIAGGMTLSEPGSLAGDLSTRELQVLQLVTQGQSSVEIGAVLGLSPKTVDTYRSRMMRKLGVANVAGLVKLTVEQGLLL